MKVVRIILGILVGMIAITLVAELIEFATVKFVSGESFEVLSTDQQRYFEIRNQTGILIFKMFYTLLAVAVAGYLTSWVTKFYVRVAISLLILIQIVSLIWAGFLSELSATGPTWMWIMLIVITPIGVYAGQILRERSENRQIQIA